jgi:hypothetical protein
LTLDDLVKSTIAFKSSRANPPKISVSRFEMSAFEEGGGLLARAWRKVKKFFTGKHMIMVKSVARSEVGAGNYNTYLLAKGVEVSDEKDKEHRVALTDGKFMGHIEYRKSEVKVRCDCPDFRWRFAWYNDKQKALYGVRPPPYKRKTDRPPVNPRQLPGMCKHLFSMVKILGSRGVVK